MFSLRYGIVLVAALVFVACGDSDSEWVYTPPEIEMAIAGTVLAADGSPIEGVSIALWDGEGFEANGWFPYVVYGASTRTASDGSYQMDRTACFVGPDDGRYLTAGKQGYQMAWKDPTECFQEVNFVLRPSLPSDDGCGPGFEEVCRPDERDPSGEYCVCKPDI